VFVSRSIACGFFLPTQPGTDCNNVIGRLVLPRIILRHFLRAENWGSGLSRISSSSSQRHTWRQGDSDVREQLPLQVLALNMNVCPGPFAAGTSTLQ
jgi:hypothetical protein